jgi:uncharacterized protein YbaR (Trm112 family)
MELFATPRSSKQLIVQNSQIVKILIQIVKEETMSEQYKDRFSKATEELEEKAAYICKSCNRLYRIEDAENNNLSCCGRTMTEQLRKGFGS